MGALNQLTVREPGTLAHTSSVATTRRSALASGRSTLDPAFHDGTPALGIPAMPLSAELHHQFHGVEGHPRFR